MEYFCPESQWNDYEIDALSTGPFTRPLASSLAMHTHSLSPHCSLRLRAPVRSFVHSLARPFTHSRAHGKEVFVDFMQFQPTVGRAFVFVYVCVYVCVSMRVCMQVSSLHFISIV